MAIIANTLQSTSAVGNREELSDVVNRITPEDTPIYSSFGTSSCKSTHPEWEIDTLEAPGANAQLEGDTYDFDAITPPDRVGTHTQILSKTFIVSQTQEAVDNAGNVEKIKEVKLKRGIELRKDVELSIVSNVASVGGSTRISGGLPSWYESSASRGGSGADGGFNSGTGLTVAATDGTQRAFTKPLLDNTMQSVYEAGGNVTRAVVSPYNKRVFTTFMSDSNVAQFRYAAAKSGSNTIVSTAEVYLGDFGELMIIPNRVMSTAATARNVHLIDPSMGSWKWLRKIKEDKQAGRVRTSDATKGVLIGEGALCVKNEAGLGVVADVFGLTAST